MIVVGAVVVSAFMLGWVGCGSAPSFPYTGTWIAHREVTRGPGIDPQSADEVSRLSLTLKNGGVFTMFDAGMKKEGEYSVEGDHVVLNVEKIAGQAMARQGEDVQKRNVPITVTPDGGKLKYFDPTGFDPGGLVLERVDGS